MTNTMSRRSRPFRPPWEVLDLVATKLDPKTLAIASCVSKSWSDSMSSDHIWQPICAAHFPAVSNLHPAIPYRRIYSLGHSSAKRRLQPPPKPRLSLDNLLFAISIKSQQNTIPDTSVIKPCSDLEVDRFELFRFSFELDREVVIMDEEDYINITWNVVLKGYEGILTMLDWKGQGRSREWWLTEELSQGGCCFSGRGSGSGLAVELKLGVRRVIGEKKKNVVEIVRVGVMSLVSWRYASIDDVLRYLQHFLLPSHI